MSDSFDSEGGIYAEPFRTAEPRLIWCERTDIHTHTFGGPHRCAEAADLRVPEEGEGLAPAALDVELDRLESEWLTAASEYGLMQGLPAGAYRECLEGLRAVRLRQGTDE